MNCVKIENNIVTKVIVCSNVSWATKHLGGTWKHVTTKTVGKGYHYLPDTDSYRPPYYQGYGFRDMPDKTSLVEWITEVSLSEEFDLDKNYNDLLIDLEQYYNINEE